MWLGEWWLSYQTVLLQPRKCLLSIYHNHRCLSDQGNDLYSKHSCWSFPTPVNICLKIRRHFGQGYKDFPYEQKKMCWMKLWVPILFSASPIFLPVAHFWESWRRKGKVTKKAIGYKKERSSGMHWTPPSRKGLKGEYLIWDWTCAINPLSEECLGSTL